MPTAAGGVPVEAKTGTSGGQSIKQAGEKAAFDTFVNGLHPNLVRLLGKLKYRTSYGQNVLKHSLEVSYLVQHQRLLILCPQYNS